MMKQNNNGQGNKSIPILKKSIDALARECAARGNRLEIVNGKVYELKRQLLGKIE